MSAIKHWLWEEEERQPLTNMEQYELYCLYKKAKENLKTEEEVLEYFRELWEE